MKKSDFISAKPSRRSDMLIDGLQHVTRQLLTINVELRILNTWLSTTPDLMEKGKMFAPDIEEFQKAVARYQEEWDDLSPIVMDSLSSIEQTSKAFTYYKKIQ